MIFQIDSEMYKKVEDQSNFSFTFPLRYSASRSLPASSTLFATAFAPAFILSPTSSRSCSVLLLLSTLYSAFCSVLLCQSLPLQALIIRYMAWRSSTVTRPSAIDQLMLTLIADFCEVFVQEVESVSRRMGCQVVAC